MTDDFNLFRSPWEVHKKTTDDVGANIAEFAIASISSLALHNKQIQITGNKPSLGSWLGVKPEFDWRTAFALFIPIGLVHLILLALIINAEYFRRSKSVGIELQTLPPRQDEGSTESLMRPDAGG